MIVGVDIGGTKVAAALVHGRWRDPPENARAHGFLRAMLPPHSPP